MTREEEYRNQEWSRWKHAILEKYLGRVSGILQRLELLYVIDGFAGKGMYDNNEKGSPLIAAQLAEKIEQHRQYKLRCINVEQNQANYDDLVQATMPYSKYVTQNFFGSFSEHTDEILNIIGQQPALFFLDPIGIKGLELHDLRPIFERGQSMPSEEPITELLLRFDVQRAIRDTGFVGKDWEFAEVNLQRLLDVMGIEDPSYWEPYVSNCGDNPLCRKEGITQAYQDRLSNYFDYVLRMPIRSREGQLKYYLIYATRSLKGVFAMNGVLYQVEDMRAEDLASYRREQNIPDQLAIPGFEKHQELPLEQKHSIELNTLKQHVLDVLRQQRMRRDDLQANVAIEKNCLGEFSGRHYTAILGGRPKNFVLPKNFVSLKSRIRLEGTPGSDSTYVSLR